LKNKKDRFVCKIPGGERHVSYSSPSFTSQLGQSSTIKEEEHINQQKERKRNREREIEKEKRKRNNNQKMNKRYNKKANPES